MQHVLKHIVAIIIEFKAGRRYQILHNTANYILLDLVLKGESISLPYFCKVSIQLPTNALQASAPVVVCTSLPACFVNSSAPRIITQ